MVVNKDSSGENANVTNSILALRVKTYQIDGSIEFCKTYVRSKNKNILLIMI